MPNPSETRTRRQLEAKPQTWQDREAVEQHFAALNRFAPAARRIVRDAPGGRAAEFLRAAAVAAPLPGQREGGSFLVEAECGVGLEIITVDALRAPAMYSVLLPLTGEVGARGPGGDTRAGPGQGLLIDPAAVERSHVAPGTHFVEFDLPKSLLRTLGAEIAPGSVAEAPPFAPLVQADLARRLLWMAVQAAHSAALPGQPAAGRETMFRRWCEMIGLTLLQEHALRDAPRSNALQAGPMPASVRRALAYIDAHADRDILLVDIAEAACVSASSLLRQFNAHVGESPGAVLRQARLDRARAELRRGTSGSVRALAERWGFQNPSKFAQAYQRRFGERPSETLVRGR